MNTPQTDKTASAQPENSAWKTRGIVPDPVPHVRLSDNERQQIIHDLQQWREMFQNAQRDFEEERRKNIKLTAQRDELLAACKLALGQLQDSKPLSGVHASSLRADIEIVKAAIANVERGN